MASVADTGRVHVCICMCHELYSLWTTFPTVAGPHHIIMTLGEAWQNFEIRFFKQMYVYSVHENLHLQNFLLYCSTCMLCTSTCMYICAHLMCSQSPINYMKMCGVAKRREDQTTMLRQMVSTVYGCDSVCACVYMYNVHVHVCIHVCT